MTWKVVIGLLAVVLVGLAAWVRLAPADPARWHLDPLSVPDPVTPNFARLHPGTVNGPDPATLAARAERAMLALPRTRRIAGSPAEGLMTFETRSRLMRFPDYTTVRVIGTADGATLAVLARSRFGRSDLGANRARIAALRAALAAEDPA